MRFEEWKAEAARIASGMYGVELVRVPKPYLWSLYAGGIPTWEAAQLCQNVITAQEGQPDMPDHVGWTNDHERARYGD